jgi:hypothetical protein
LKSEKIHEETVIILGIVSGALTEIASKRAYIEIASMMAEVISTMAEIAWTMAKIASTETQAVSIRSEFASSETGFASTKAEVELASSHTDEVWRLPIQDKGATRF